MEQGLRQGCLLSPLFFEISFAATLTAVLQIFSEDTPILAELVHLKEPPMSMEPEPAMYYAIGTQLRDPINSGLTRWRMAVS